MHPVVLASAMLSTAVLVSAFGPRLFPGPAVAAAPAAQACSAGSTGFYGPSTEQVIEFGSPFAAFQQEVVKPALEGGESFRILDFEEVGGQIVWYYETDC